MEKVKERVAECPPVVPGFTFLHFPYVPPGGVLRGPDDPQRPGARRYIFTFRSKVQKSTSILSLLKGLPGSFHELPHAEP